MKTVSSCKIPHWEPCRYHLVPKSQTQAATGEGSIHTSSQPSEWKGFNNLLAQEMQYLSQGHLFIAYLEIIENRNFCFLLNMTLDQFHNCILNLIEPFFQFELSIFSKWGCGDSRLAYINWKFQISFQSKIPWDCGSQFSTQLANILWKYKTLNNRWYGKASGCHMARYKAVKERRRLIKK